MNWEPVIVDNSDILDIFATFTVTLFSSISTKYVQCDKKLSGAVS